MNNIIFGTMRIPHEKMQAALKSAIESGYRSIDTAFIYKNEEAIGEALKNLKKQGINRIPIQSKLWPSQMDVETTRESLMGTLKRLQIKKIEYYMIHRSHFDMNKNISAWKDLIKLKKEGLIDHIGVSNFNKDMLRILIKETGVKPEFNQIEVSVSNVRGDRIQFCQKENIEVQAWSIMGHPEKTLNNEVIKRIAKNHNVDPALVLIAYPIHLGTVPLIKSANPERIKHNLKALNIKFTKEEMQELKELNSFDNKAAETFAI